MELAEVCAAFLNYKLDSQASIERILNNYKQLKPEHLSKLLHSYTHKLEHLEEAVDLNESFFQQILLPIPLQPQHPVSFKNSSRVRQLLKQLVRDWSADGKPERDQSFSLILNELQEVFPSPNLNGHKISVLCPGAGLCRLPFEIAILGYRSEANEISHFMRLTSDLIFSPSTTINQYKIAPFAHDFSNLLEFSQAFKKVEIPDLHPSSILDFTRTNGDFVEMYSDQPESWDCVITCFFMDTASNIFEYIETIYTCLKIGGVWINFGPLLYNYGDLNLSSPVELSWDEFRHVVGEFGFLIAKEDFRHASYASSINPMLNMAYKCIFFTAYKLADQSS